MDTMGIIFFGGILVCLLCVAVDKIYFILQTPKEKRRFIFDHFGMVCGKKYRAEGMRKEYLFPKERLMMNYEPIEDEFFNTPSRYEVEIILNEECRKIFDDNYLFNTCQIGDSYLIQVEEIVFEKSSLLNKEETRTENVKLFKKVS